VHPFDVIPATLRKTNVGAHSSSSSQNHIYAEPDPPAFMLVYADSAEKSSCIVMDTPALHFCFYLAQRNDERMTTSIINNPNVF